MATRKYPYQAFLVMPSLLIRLVTVTSRSSWGGTCYDQIESGKNYDRDNLHLTKDAALAAGEKKLLEQEARLTKQQTNVSKRRANLTKAKGAV